MDLPKQDIYMRLKEERRPVIIYGMGNGADKIITRFELHGIPVSGIAASDDFVRGQSFRGFTVRKISDFEKQFGDFVIVIAFGTSIPDVMGHIYSLAQRHTVYAPDVPVYGDNYWSLDFFTENRSDIERAYSLLADERSRFVYESMVCFKLTGELNYLRRCETDKDEVFENIIPLSGNETYLDLGAYRGDTIDELLHYSGGRYSHITALEPDRKTFAKLKEHTKDMKNVRLFRMGIWSGDRDIPFDGSLGRGSSIQSSGNEMLAVTCIDTLYAVRNVSYIKMDVEGCERQALLGGIKTIRRDRPKMNIAAYHRSEDLFSLILQLHDIEPSYCLYLRKHPYIPAWDINLYATVNFNKEEHT